MTAAEFTEQLKAADALDSPEQGHEDADMVLCDLLKELGYGEGVEVFLKMTRWYA